MPIMMMNHEIDPKKEIMDSVKNYLDDVQLTGAQVLIGIYIRPEKTKGGIIMTDAYREEDVYQGKAGLILKMGPAPMDEKDKEFFGESEPKVGDWVVYRPSDGFPMEFADKQKCRILADRRQIKMFIKSPDCVF